MKGFFDGIDPSMEHAALIDGCTRWGAFVRVALPSAIPSAMPSSDMLTAGDVTGGASAVASSAMPEPVASAMSTVEPATVSDAAQGASGFVLEHYQASIAIAVACIAGFIALNLVRGRQGRVWRAVRDDPIAASVSGISPGGAKVSAFVVSSFLAALAGAVYAQILSYVGPTAFGVSLSLSLLVGVVLGGRGSLLGAVIGGVLLVGLTPLIGRLAEGRDWPEQVSSNAPSLVFGLLVVVVVAVAPAGVAGLWQRRRSRIR
jgi:ABC-type branched-subunit amino acid transport system permease subunit